MSSGEARQVSAAEGEQVSSVEVDFLEDTCEISLEVKEQASAFLDNMDAEPRYEPESPTYSPQSPIYSPPSPSS